ADAVGAVRRVEIREAQHASLEGELSVPTGRLGVAGDDVPAFATDEDLGLVEGEQVGRLIVPEEREAVRRHACSFVPHANSIRAAPQPSTGSQAPAAAAPRAEPRAPVRCSPTLPHGDPRVTGRCRTCTARPWWRRASRASVALGC